MNAKLTQCVFRAITAMLVSLSVTLVCAQSLSKVEFQSEGGRNLSTHRGIRRMIPEVQWVKPDVNSVSRIAGVARCAAPTNSVIAPSRMTKVHSSPALEAVPHLIEWIVAKMGWVAQQPPSIRLIPHERLVEELGGNHHGSNNRSIELRALYSRERQTIYLDETWNPDDLRDRAALVHELVHHLQELNNISARCRAEHELQAYHLMIAWLREQGIQDPYQFMNTDEFTINLFSQCWSFE